jgi:hypothetical protein
MMQADLHLPAEFDMPASRLRFRREHLIAELRPSVRRRRGRRRWALTLAGAACAAVAAIPVVDLLGSNGSGPGVIEKAVAAVSSEEAIYHSVSRLTTDGVTRYWDEAWIGPDGRRHGLLYEANGGDRGSLWLEASWDGSIGSSFDARTNTLVVIRAHRDAGPVPSPQGPTLPSLNPTEDAGAQLRRLHEQGRLELAGTEEVRGQRAYRLVADTWVDPSEEGHTERVEFLVDAETYLPLEQRDFSTHLVDGRPVTDTATREFLTYEKLPTSQENLAKLEPRPHPGAEVLDPERSGVPAP